MADPTVPANDRTLINYIELLHKERSLDAPAVQEFVQAHADNAAFMRQRKAVDIGFQAELQREAQFG